ncbi:MAG: hypothetical protein VKL39_11850, partial [Leptolyngbyaceae bacterium]|nr:hypothetical protein [Leptolyngbyaceae bacterium]
LRALFAYCIDKGAHMAQKKREPYQKKRPKSGHQSKGGVAEDYDEVKKCTTFGITPTAKKGLNLLARKHNVSVSEFIEQIGRGILIVALEKTAVITQKNG